MSEPLSASDFEAFFRAVYGYAPFPWQARLMARVAEDGWPQVLDLPTGSGKTAALDVAVFHLALDAGREVRRARLRIVYVVDRRTIVDQAFDRARKLVAAIDAATEGVLVAVRERLLSYADGDLPLEVALLRGAIARSDAWARSPDQPLVAVSTVDQVGSRLLFRGYGVSDAMKPIHAGLLGNDVLYLLDEVHLSQPFRETLGAIAGRYGAWADTDLPRRFGVVEMSATPGEVNPEAFGLDDEDRRHDVLSTRLRASKPTTLVESSGRGFVGEVEKQLTGLLGAGTTAAVVVNRVAVARELSERLARELRAKADVVLVTGRMRPLDRETVEQALSPRVRSGRERDAEAKPLVVVATQCIEAGADFDFDVLVTECASLDALRQRFGRLDRLGAAAGAARGVVVANKDSLKGDPVYGDALGRTWAWLNEHAGDGGEIDFGLSGLTVPGDAEAQGLLAPKPHAPVLLPAHLDAWVQTWPVPVPDPEVALWLHGPERGVADVQIVWRADLGAQELERAEGDADAWARVLAAVEVLPPASGEAMSVPFAAARRWLRGLAEPDVFDVEGAPEVSVEDEWSEKEKRAPRVAIAWRGPRSQVVRGDGKGDARLKPGDTIIVPASYGGISQGTWAPNATAAPVDLAEVAVLRQRGRAVLRLHPAVLAGLFGDGGPTAPSPAPRDGEELDDPRQVREWLANVSAPPLTSEGHRLLDHLIAESRRTGRGRGVAVERIARVDDADAAEGGEVFVVRARARVRGEGGEVTTEDDQASFTGVKVTLREHMANVGDRAQRYGARSGLPASALADVRLAGRWHDAGKADPRFQRLLHGGSAFKALTEPEPLAKSVVQLNTPQRWREAFERSAYPRGTRHEVMSVALMEVAQGQLKGLANDWELVQHLVASHHGRCRPLAPWVPDEAPVDVAVTVDGVTASASSRHDMARLDSGVGERFWRLVRRYGWWGLAWLETVLRLGDHRQSEAEQKGEGIAS